MSQVLPGFTLCLFPLFPFLFISSSSLSSAWVVVILGSRLKRNNDGPEKGVGFYTKPNVEMDQPRVHSLPWNLDNLSAVWVLLRNGGSRPVFSWRNIPYMRPHWDLRWRKQGIDFISWKRMCCTTLPPSALCIISLSQEKSVMWSLSTCSFHAPYSSSRGERDREDGSWCHKPWTLLS